MSLISYNYLLTDFLNGIVDTSTLYSEIVSSDIITALDHINEDTASVDILFKAELSTGDETTLSGVVATHDGVSAQMDPVQVDLADELRDRSGKLRVHQTSRKLGTSTYWTGAGDDLTDITNKGGGEPFLCHHTISGSLTNSIYIDFNISTNETWIHEGLLMWKDCKGDTITLEMVSRATSIVPGTNTNYNLYGGYMVIPAAGDGTIEVTSDITDPTGGLIYMPVGDMGNIPTAFWNATFNSSTGLYEDITAAPYGDGNYNMFAGEIVFARFANRIILLGDGFMPLSCSDTDQMGNGFRLKMTCATSTLCDDHEWCASATLVFHRRKSS